jgi:NAD-dependent SIR2 family protein deacetylase
VRNFVERFFLEMSQLLCTKCNKNYDENEFSDRQKTKKFRKCNYCLQDVHKSQIGTISNEPPQKNDFISWEFQCARCKYPYTSRDAFSDKEMKNGKYFRTCKICTKNLQERKEWKDQKKKQDREEMREVFAILDNSIYMEDDD